ncbi:hypothetical protein CJ030_MR3G001922 [Morella rubra]|uniref:Uncharacterized protein n=1 Tax=Morella rubra TaxID=262757 RepID=A0A6A1W559_9ROSI|nr:hypothetical protein CJ030_MR3G001922 [Morella rubra]
MATKVWTQHLQQTVVASMDMVREFYDAVLLVLSILDVAWEVTIRNTRVMFLPDELERFIGYERPAGAFPVIGLPKKDWSPSYGVFGMIMSPSTVVSEG